jgi:hypothetical protein
MSIKLQVFVKLIIMHIFLEAQIIGALAVLIALSVYQFNSRRLMLKLNGVAAILYAISFYMLGAPTGAAMNIIGSARCFVFTAVVPSKKNIWILFLFILIAIIGTSLTWKGKISLLAMGVRYLVLLHSGKLILKQFGCYLS